MGNKFAKLIDVKSIVTIILTVVFSVLAIRGDSGSLSCKPLLQNG